MHNDAKLIAPPPLSELAQANLLSLFLDFDGTLVNIASAPDAVIVPNDLTPNIRALSQRLSGRLAIITGRPLAALDGFLGSDDITAVGSHGGEYRGAPPPSPPLSQSSLDRLIGLKAAWPNLFIEHKPFGLAVHYRQEPDAEESVIKFMEEIGAYNGLVSKSGKMLVELGPPNVNKGNAVRKLMNNAPFSQSTPIFIGDDITDEDGFAVVNEFGGFGILIGQPRETLARYTLPDPPAVLRWLKF